MGVNSWALMDDAFSIDGVMPSLWGYPDTIEELQQKLLYTTEELKSFQANANEKIRKQSEYIDRLVQFLKITCQERDEARNQLHLLLKKLMPPSPVELSQLANYVQPESPHIRQMRNNSSIMESDSISDTRNQQSYVNSPVESFFDTVTSPDLSNINMADSSHIVLPQQPLFPEYNSNNCSAAPSLVGTSSGTPKYNQAYARIEQLVMKKPLPEKGKLVSAIMDAGPLLQTLLIAGPLPRWRNPPTLQPLLIPPISVNNGSISKSPSQAAVVSPSILLNSLPHHENSEGLPQMHASSIGGGLCAMKTNAGSPHVRSYQSLSTKRMKTN
ncbi:uncharacterized protein M6B38_340255 [Iris pallida]|uniref:Uncharacterized protein n=1 Tax=Iris pallida TaxID=29817 RepID=A0AAX6GXV3_IRIPA|nr:uncharacterized protein M6B38_340255 [Iris pallida]